LWCLTRILGEHVKALLVLKEGTHATEVEIRNYSAQHPSEHKVPTYLEIYREPLFTNPAGKVRWEFLGVRKKNRSSFDVP
jgi:hypothetical protein